MSPFSMGLAQLRRLFDVEVQDGAFALFKFFPKSNIRPKLFLYACSPSLGGLNFAQFEMLSSLKNKDCQM